MLLLDELQIKPVQVHAKRQEITPEQFQQLQEHLHRTEEPQPDQTTSTDSSTTSTSDSTTVQPVIELLEQQVAYLKQEIEGHKEEKKELLQSNDRIQQLLSVSMSEGSKLRAEVDRLRLLEHQPTVQATEPPKDFEDIEEEIQQVDPVVVQQRASFTKAFLGFATIFVFGGLLWFAAASGQESSWFPSMQEKIKGALQLTDSKSIVPYRYEAGSLR